MGYAIKRLPQDDYFAGFDKDTKPQWGNTNQAQTWDNETHAEAQALLLAMPEGETCRTTSTSVLFLLNAADYFVKRPTDGEDKAYWANTYNAESCKRAAALIETTTNNNQDLKATNAALVKALEDFVARYPNNVGAEKARAAIKQAKGD